MDLSEESLQEAEIAAGDAGDRGDGLCVGEVVGVEFEAEFVPVPGQYEGEFFTGQGPVVVGESDAAVELRVAGEGLLDAGHADEQQPVIPAVVAVTQVFDGVGRAFGLVDDDQLDVVDRLVYAPAGGYMLVDADVDAAVELLMSSRSSRRGPATVGV
ncbi:hypothetical protein [Nocardia sp. bgisy118]|uniref:hypothetical protein n=1 Tax=Nocardia sp. bgisy118 TaxID=3413786 RepID=UPI003F4A69C7